MSNNFIESVVEVVNRMGMTEKTDLVNMSDFRDASSNENNKTVNEFSRALFEGMHDALFDHAVGKISSDGLFAAQLTGKNFLKQNKFVGKRRPSWVLDCSVRTLTSKSKPGNAFIVLESTFSPDGDGRQNAATKALLNRLVFSLGRAVDKFEKTLDRKGVFVHKVNKKSIGYVFEVEGGNKGFGSVVNRFGMAFGAALGDEIDIFIDEYQDLKAENTFDFLGDVLNEAVSPHDFRPVRGFPGTTVSYTVSKPFMDGFVTGMERNTILGFVHFHNEFVFANHVTGVAAYKRMQWEPGAGWPKWLLSLWLEQKEPTKDERPNWFQLRYELESAGGAKVQNHKPMYEIGLVFNKVAKRFAKRLLKADVVLQACSGCKVGFMLNAGTPTEQMDDVMRKFGESFGKEVGKFFDKWVLEERKSATKPKTQREHHILSVLHSLAEDLSLEHELDDSDLVREIMEIL